MKIKDTVKLTVGLVGLLVITGCQGEGCYNCDSGPVVVETSCCNHYAYRLDVTVSDTLGFTLGGATVELVVATVPEQRFFASTDRDGVARFFFDSPSDVVAIAYACAPGYECNASDIGTRPDHGNLFIDVVLNF